MKKTSCIILIIVMIVTIFTTSFTTFGIYYNAETYRTCEEIQEYVEENIDNYFLPAAYDISPFTVLYGEYLEEPIFECVEFYEKNVVYDEKGKISVPPIYSLVVEENLYNNYTPQFYASYMIYNLNNKNDIVMTPSMWRVLHNNNTYYNGEFSEKSASLDSAVNAYIAPWTLNNHGELYTWPELMAMSDSELNSLNYESYEFSKFISSVKSELEKRGWWKEEYQAKYDILASHKDDYNNLQPQNEVLSVAGENVYLARIEQEYKSGNLMSLNSVISVNIYSKEFFEKVSALDASVVEKYSEVICAIKDEWNVDRRECSVGYGNENYKSYIQSESAPEGLACSPWLEILANFVDNKDEYAQYNGLAAFSNIEDFDYSKEELTGIFEEFNYVVSDAGAFSFEVVENIANNSKNENIDYFAYDTSVVFNYDKNILYPWWRVAAMDWTDGHFDDKLSAIDDYNRVIERLQYLYDNVDSGTYKEVFKNNIDYLKAYAGKTGMPSTGENTALYIAIAGGAIVAMTSLVIRRKKKIA